MKFDMHCHTKEGSIDAKVDVISYIKHLIHNGYDGMLITDHNSYKGFEKWKDVAKDLHLDKAFTVLKGIEYDTKDGGHMIAVLPDGVHSKLLEIRGMTVEQLEKIVHGLGGILGPAHPYGTGFYAYMHNRIAKKNKELIKKFDFIEIFNSCTNPIDNFRSSILAKRYNKPTTAGSDSHKTYTIGTAATIFKHHIENNNDLIDAIKNHKIEKAEATLKENLYKEVNGLLKYLGIIGYWIYNKLGSLLRAPQRIKELNRHYIYLKR